MMVKKSEMYFLNFMCFEAGMRDDEE